MRRMGWGGETHFRGAKGDTGASANLNVHPDRNHFIRSRNFVMRLRLIARWGLVATTAIGFLAISACGKTKPEPVAGGPKAGEQRVDPSTLKDEIPGGELAAVMAAHYAGLGHMERYEYREAVEAFRTVQKRAPGWIPGAINLAIALLNDSGVKAEEAKKAGGAPSAANFDEALELLAGVLKREPNNPYAHFCRGIMLEQLGNIAEAHSHFKRVTEIDPNDAAGWYWLGATLADASREAPDADARMKVLKEKSTEEIKYFTKARRAQPLPDAGCLSVRDGGSIGDGDEGKLGVVCEMETDEPRSRSVGGGAWAGRYPRQKVWGYGAIWKHCQSVARAGEG